jgi:hypothetical protein
MQNRKEPQMSFAFTYQDVVKRPNPMVNLNPLKRGTGKTVSLQDRVDTLNKSAAWKKTIKDWLGQGKKVDRSRLPKVSMEKLGSLWIDEDIQRQLDVKHCANTIANVIKFDPALMQCVQCIKTSEGKFISIDTQHTASSIAALIDAGMLDGTTDWKEFEFPFQYIETDNLAFARKAFGILNGKGKKQQSVYQQLRNSVFVIRIDNDTSDSDDVEIERKVSIAEKWECFPVENKSTLAKYPGTFSNIATFKTLNENEIDVSCEWHHKYFHYEPLHVSLFFTFRDISRHFNAAKIDITDQLKEDLAALIQAMFCNLYQYQEAVTEAYRRWNINKNGYEVAWNDDAYACALLQLYKRFGGTEKVAPSIINKFDGLIEFFDDDILDLGK